MIQSSQDAHLVYRQMTDKYNRCFSKHIPIFTDFLNLHEQSIFQEHIQEFSHVHYALFGGYHDAERRILAFYPKDMTHEFVAYPLELLEIQPRNKRFSQKLTHRDYLGALLNLGINRNRVGDIIVQDCSAYVFVYTTLTQFITDHLLTVRQTEVTVHKLIDLPEDVLSPRFKTIRGTIASLRLDALVKLALSLSRGKASDLIKASKVYVNSKLITSPAYVLKIKDKISVRGYGKFIIHYIGEKTKKDRTPIEINKYV